MNALDEVASISADLRSWLEWQEYLGASALPRESVLDIPVVDIPSQRAARTIGAEPKPTGLRQKPEPAVPSPPRPQPQSNRQSGTEKPAILSEKWKALMAGPTTHRVEGPTGSSLTIVRGSGSSPEAEAMLDRMLENVLGLRRNQVCVVDLIRDMRSPREIGEGFVDALPTIQPSLMVLMGRFAVAAVYGESHSVDDLRSQWNTLQYGDRTAEVRVSHHPEAILLLAARGETSPKREAFVDLKAVKERLISI